jgi:hypothetical protein
VKALLPLAALSPKSRKNEADCLRSWERFCVINSLPVLPTTLEALRVYIEDMPARVTAGTLRHVVAAVRRWHLEAGLGDPADEALLDELRRAQRRGYVPEIVPCLTQDLATIINGIPDSPRGARDKLLVLLSYSGRVSSPAMAKLDRGDVHIDPRGMVLDVWYGRRKRPVTFDRYHDTRYCVVSAMEHYLRRLDDEEPALIRVCRRGRITTRRLGLRRGEGAISFRCRNAGVKRFPLTSLRAGMMVSATNRGADEYAIMRQHGYHRASTVRQMQARLNLKQVDVVDRLGL